MRWPVFAVFAFIMLALEVGVRNTLRLDSVHHGVSPSFVAGLLVFILFFAPKLTALWACWILGMIMDLMPSIDGTGSWVIGPAALGYVFGGAVIIPLRTMVFRRRSLTMGAMTFVFSLTSAVMSVFVLMVRHWYPSASTHTYSALNDLVHRLFEAIYSGVLAIPMGWAMLLTLPLWGFQTTTQRRTAWW